MSHLLTNLNEIREWLMVGAELYICYILTREYYWGRSDMDIKREEKRKQAKRKMTFESITTGEGK